MQTERFPYLMVSGKISAYVRSLEVAKILHMVEPNGNTGLHDRVRPVTFKICGGHIEKSCGGRKLMKFREFVWAYRTARSRRKIAYGVLRTGIRPFAFVRGPVKLALTNRMGKKRGAVASPLYYSSSSLSSISKTQFSQYSSNSSSS